MQLFTLLILIFIFFVTPFTLLLFRGFLSKLFTTLCTSSYNRSVVFQSGLSHLRVIAVSAVIFFLHYLIYIPESFFLILFFLSSLTLLMQECISFPFSSFRKLFQLNVFRLFYELSLVVFLEADLYLAYFLKVSSCLLRKPVDYFTSSLNNFL